jgi:hypothetical protein
MFRPLDHDPEYGSSPDEVDCQSLAAINNDPLLWLKIVILFLSPLMIGPFLQGARWILHSI